MDAITSPAAARPRAVQFSGRWQEFLVIKVVNLLLTIITLGIYRFWAKARERRYLWAHTRIIDDHLEWTGTGGEMFVGFIVAMGVLAVWFIVIVGGAALLGQWLMIVGMVAFYAFALWAFGFAQFRALRYRLSRTYWRGIRGGSDSSGVGYGWTALGNNIVAGLTFGILTPRAIADNWNDRIRAMSFGPHMLDSNVDTEGLQSRWMVLYAVYLAFLGMTFAYGASVEDTEQGIIRGPDLALSLAFFAGIGLVMASFWALFYRKAAGTFRMEELTAQFPVPTSEWFKFYGKLIGLSIVTLGLGTLMWGYFRWQFIMDRLELYGVVDLDALKQSTTEAPTDAEGLADAFDVGAF